MIIFILLGTLVLFLLVSAIIFFVFKYHNAILIKENTLQEEKIAHQKELIQATLQAEEKEKLRLSKNVHDEMGTYSSLLKMNVSRLSLIPNQNEKMKEILNEQKSLITELSSFVRNISLELYSPTLKDFGLLAGIEELIDVIERNTEIKITFEYPNKTKRFAQNIEIQLLRIIKEIFNNTIKHAKPKHIKINYTYLNKDLVIAIHHDGKGINEAFYKILKKESKGFGLKSIETRLQSLQGDICYYKEKQNYIIKLKISIDHE